MAFLFLGAATPPGDICMLKSISQLKVVSLIFMNDAERSLNSLLSFNKKCSCTHLLLAYQILQLIRDSAYQPIDTLGNGVIHSLEE